MSETYCPAPWVHIALHSAARDYRPCCAWLDNTPGPSDTISDPMHSNFMEKLRSDMLDGKKIYNCTRCYDNESTTGNSYRTFLKGLYGEPRSVNLRYLEMDFGNLCNLKCRMCSSIHSSKWISDESSMGRRACNLARRQFKDINLDLDNLDCLKLTGGEPSLEQDQIREMLYHIKNLKGP